MNAITRAPREWVSDHAIVLSACASGGVLVLGVAAIMFIGRINQVPSWWVESSKTQSEQAEIVIQAEHFENAISTQLTAVRDPENPRWAVAITPDQANAWLSVRLQRTIETHFGPDAWPTTIDQLRVVIQSDRLIVGARLHHSSGSVVVWGRVDIEIDAQGNLWARVSSTHLGRAWVPASMVVGSHIEIGAGQLKLGDGRLVEVLGVRVHSGQLELVMETRFIE